MNDYKIFRGDEWDVNLSLSKSHLSGTLKILNTNNRRIYKPLSETPDVFLRFSEIGSLYWEQPKEIEILKEKTQQFLNNFSYINDFNFNQEVSINSFIEEAKTTSNIISIIKLNNKDKSPNISFIFNRITGLSEQKNEKEEDVLNKWMINKIQENLENEPCIHQIETRNSSKSYNLTVNPKSLKAAIWFQIANIIISKKYIKDCSYLLCKKLYFTTRSNRNYCSSSCQTRAKSYRAYHNLSTELSNKNIKPEKSNELSPPPKLQPIQKPNEIIKSKEYEPIEEYDPDFGFFENQESEKRILGD